MKEQKRQLLANDNSALGHDAFFKSTESLFGPIESLLGLSRNMRRHGTVQPNPSHGSRPRNEPISPTYSSTTSSSRQEVLQRPSRRRHSVQVPIQSDQRDQDDLRPIPMPTTVPREAENSTPTVQPPVRRRGFASTAQETTELNTHVHPYRINPENFKATSLVFRVRDAPERPRRVTGVIAAGLGISLMPHRTAFSLGLERVGLSENDPSTICFVSGGPALKVIGKSSELVWQEAGLRRARGSTITFFVVENMGHDMIIGSSTWRVS